MTALMIEPIAADGLPIGGVTANPDKWASAPDNAAKAICRQCPRRWACARDAVELPQAEGLWAGIVIPAEEGRGRTFALKQLRDLANRNGFPVRKRRRVYLDIA